MQSLLSIQNMSEQNTEYLYSSFRRKSREIVLFSFSNFQLFFHGNALIKYKLYKSSKFLEFSPQRVRNRIKNPTAVILYI